MPVRSPATIGCCRVEGSLTPGTIFEDGKTRRATGRRERRQGIESFEDAARTVASLVEESVKRRVQGQGRVAVSFSGGLDSSLLALAGF